MQLAGGIFHVTARGVRRSTIFHDERDHSVFLGLLGRLIRKLSWRCHAYCLMPNHYHLVLETPEADLSAGMHWLNSRHAQWFNERHGLEGHVFDRRFYSALVESEWHLVQLSRYVVLNPVRAGLCAHPADWPWSSYRAAVGKNRLAQVVITVAWLELFGSNLDSARIGYEAFVQEAIPSAGPP
jgi:putative transposase